MPYLRTKEDGTRVLLESQDLACPRGFRLADEGLSFLVDVMHLGEGDDVRASDLELLLERGWAMPFDLQPVAPPGARKSLAPSEPPGSPGAKDANKEIRTIVGRRARGREVALQALYLVEQNSGIDLQEVNRFLERRLREPKLIAFTRALVDGVHAHQKHLDTLISGVAENWRLDRMAAIDRNILRLGAYEMLYCPDVPTKVAINEALELAKRYSTAQSSRFVNGILDRLQQAERESEPPAEAESS